MKVTQKQLDSFVDDLRDMPPDRPFLLHPGDGNYSFLELTTAQIIDAMRMIQTNAILNIKPNPLETIAIYAIVNHINLHYGK